MDTNFYQGNLKRWDDDKGLGFIEQNNGKGDIFLHISALKKMSRRPVAGDIIHYQIHTENNGKKRAVNAKIEGVSELQPRPKRKTKNKTGNGWLSTFFVVIFFVLAGSVIYNKFFGHISANNPIETLSSPEKHVNYTCSGKVYCSEMTSCEEAKFYQNNCPGTKMDGDGDGIPCESQWCSW
ncbi:excalibur calcium-binding domain-containing protein [Endothiovibrio diazotrophicus]